MVKPNKAVTFSLVGGLGNQLFIYFAGKYFSDLSKLPVRFSLSEHSKGVTKHSSSLLSFELDDEFTSELLVKSLFRTFLVRAVPSGRWANSLSQKLRQWDAPGVGAELDADAIKPGTFVRGYFQTRKYAERALEGGFRLELQNPSRWFREMSKQISPTSLAIHVRRGDYMNFSKSHGALSEQYFLGVLMYFQSVGLVKANDVWVFSDDIEQVRAEFESVGIHGLTYVRPPQGTDPAESLVLMSKFSRIAPSNSTFSWWSAILNPEAMVVAPSKWFRGMEDPQDLIPKSWIRLPSIWKD